MKRSFLLNSLIQFILLMGLWLLMSGHYDFTHITMGVVSGIAVVWLHLGLRKYYIFEDEIAETADKLKDSYPFKIRFFRLLFYVPWLIWQIVVASLQVAYAVLRPKMPIDPALIRFKTRLPNIGAKVILGNSITLTPGTITVQVNKDEFLVHGLMDISATGITDGSLPTEVARLYEKQPDQVVYDIKIIKSGVEI